MEKIPSDVLILMAIDLDLPSILNLCLTNSKFDKAICKSMDFWRKKLSKDFPGIKPIPFVRNTKKYYENIYSEGKKGILASNPLAVEKDELIRIMKTGAENYKDVSSLLGFCLAMGVETHLKCRDQNVWKNMVEKFYSHIKGDYKSYKEKYYSNVNWREFYLKLAHSPLLAETGFL